MKLKIIFLILLIINSIFLVNALPDYFDWRNKDGQNWMTSVKDQGDTCGSCWAFSAIGAVEVQYNIAKNQSGYDLDLSEEYLVSDCFQSTLPYSDCRGGWNYQALEYIKDSGISNETCFSYNDYSCNSSGSTCSTTTCTYNTNNRCSDYTCSDRCDNWQNDLHKIDDYEQVSLFENITEIKTYLVNHGPIAASMRINYGYFDSNSIYRCSTDSPVNHAIIITGYNQTGQYWIVKNSWGTSWPPGIGGGYFNVGFGECSIESMTYGVDLTLCTCTSWTYGSCGTGGCSESEKPYTRTCTPSGCDEESKCEFDSSCIPGPGEDITVCASGCDYTSIQTAVIHSTINDKVIVYEGNYNENVRMNSTTSPWLECYNNSRIYGTDNEGVKLKDVDVPTVFGCIIDGFTYGIYIEGTTNNGLIQNNTLINNGIGIYLKDLISGVKIKQNFINNSATYGIQFYAGSWANGAITNYLEYNTIKNNGKNIYTTYGNDNTIRDNEISTNNGYGFHLESFGGSTNIDAHIYDNVISNHNDIGLYLYGAGYCDINNNSFCSPNTNYDISNSGVSNSGDGNTCEKPGSWNDDGTTGCTSYCDPPAETELLFPPNNYESASGSVALVCEATDNFELVNITLYHNISGIWQANQTKNISGTSNITVFYLENLPNGTSFIWNYIAYDNYSRGTFASANWSMKIIIDDTPPNVNIISPLNQTYNISSIDFNVTIGEDGECEYSLNNGATNFSMSTLDNRNFSATNSSMLNGNYLANFYCTDAVGNLNYTESVFFNINAPLPPSDIHKFYIHNSSNNPVAWFGNFGNIILKGNCTATAICTAPANSFIIRNSTDSTTAYIDSSGNLCVEKGDCSDESATCNPTRNAFIIRNSTKYNMSYIDSDGDLCLTRKLYENSIYV